MTEFASLSIVKRDKLRKEARERRLREMRANLPILTVQEIRRNRIPLYDALIIELNEEAYVSSAHFIQQLVAYQNEQVIIHGEDSKIGLRPKLVHNNEILQKLYETFKEAEDAHFSGDTIREYEALQNLAVYYAYGHEDWWWIGEQLLVQCINVIYQFTRDGGKRDATCQYLYGRFLLTQNGEIEQSMPYLDGARSLSENKFWSAKKLFKDTLYDATGEESVFIECCKLLYQALMHVVEYVRKTDLKYAALLCSIARKRANEACFYKGEAQAYLMQGYCEFEDGDYLAAINSFYSSLRKQIKAHSQEGVCQIRILIHKAFQKLNKLEQAFECLKTLLQYAKENNLLYYEALAYRYIGEFYINQGRSAVATPNLLKSLDILLSLNAMNQVEQVRNFAAISTGQELMTEYIKLIIKLGEGKRADTSLLYKALAWKDIREKFWSDEDKSTIATSSLFLGSIEQMEDDQNLTVTVADLEENTETGEDITEASSQIFRDIQIVD